MKPRPRNFVSEMKDMAKAMRGASGATDDFTGTLMARTETHQIILQYLDGYLCGALVLANEEMPPFRAWLEREG